jgi:pyruvate/2-oxoglutarate dehydrogenase complex dihydrolipoamide acyltransferase (E2) component
MTIRMPKLNETGENGIIAEILVQVGDEVQQGQPVLSVEMEKAIVEIESPFRGVVGKINVAKGDEVAIEDVLIELEESQG